MKNIYYKLIKNIGRLSVPKVVTTSVVRTLFLYNHKHVVQELLTLLEPLSSSPVFSGVQLHVA